MTRVRFSLIFMLLVLATTALAADGLAPRVFTPVQEGFNPQAGAELPYHPTRLLVQLTPTAMKDVSIGVEKGAMIADARTGLAGLDNILAARGASSIERPYRPSANKAVAQAFGKDRWLLVNFDRSADLPALAQVLRADASVEAVSLDWRAFPMAVPNDPYYADQWGHNNTGQMLSYDWSTYSHENGDPVGTPGFDAHAEEAWDKSQGYGSSSVVIAILDSGVDMDHPDLNIVAGYDFGDNDTNPDDNSSQPGHGTCCAGVAAAMANNNLGVAGVAGGSGIMACKVANSAGSMYFSYIQDALYWAADNGADVISMSLGAALSSDAATDAALSYAYNAGCIILAATGNENASTISYPAVHDQVMGIGAASPCGDRKRSAASSLYLNPGVDADPNDYTCDGERWWGSNYGTTSQDDRGAVDIIAPTILPTTDIGGSGGYVSGDYEMWFNGTSCATPYAAGVAALVISANPTYTPSQVWTALTSTATDVVNVESGSGWDRYSGYGMVNADAAIGNTGPVAPTADFAGTPTSGQYPPERGVHRPEQRRPHQLELDLRRRRQQHRAEPQPHLHRDRHLQRQPDGEQQRGQRQRHHDRLHHGHGAARSHGGLQRLAHQRQLPPDGELHRPVRRQPPPAGAGSSATAAAARPQNPSHEYTAAGTYDVSLTVSNANGSDSLTRTGYITVTEPGVTTFVTASGENSVLGTVSGSYASTTVSDGVNETITEVLYTGHPRKQYSYAQHEWFLRPARGRGGHLPSGSGPQQQHRQRQLRLRVQHRRRELGGPGHHQQRYRADLRHRLRHPERRRHGAGHRHGPQLVRHLPGHAVR